MSETEELQLYERAKNGDEKAFEDILQKHEKTIVELVNKYKKNIKSQDVDDLKNIGRLVCNYAIKNYDETKNTKFNTFLYNCLENRFKTEVTKDKQANNFSNTNAISIDDDGKDGDKYIPDIKDEEKTPEEKLLEKEKFAYIKNELKKKLSVEQQRVLALHVAGYTYKEIAGEMGKKVKFVDYTLTQIKKKMAYLKGRI